MISPIEYAIRQQGIEAAWRGPEPENGAQITPAYCAELVDDLPRIVYAEGETGTLNITQLAADYDTALAYLSNRLAEKAQREADAAATKANNQIRALLNASPDQIETWITNNVTDLQSARAVLIRLAQALSAIAREQFAG